MTGLLAFSRSMSESIDLGQRNREIALATAAARGIIENLYAADIERVFALYNAEAADDPDGSGTAPGAFFTVDGLPVRPGDADGLAGEIEFPVPDGSPGELREDLPHAQLGMPLDLDLDGALDGADHSLDYRVLPVLVRVEWRSGRDDREFEVTTILGAR